MSLAHLDSAWHFPPMEEAALLVAGVVWARVHIHRVQELAHWPHRRLQRSTSTSFSRTGALQGTAHDPKPIKERVPYAP